MNSKKDEKTMNAKIAPIGPLAIGLRLFTAGKRAITVVTVLTCAALLVGIGLLLA